MENEKTDLVKKYPKILDRLNAAKKIAEKENSDGSKYITYTPGKSLTNKGKHRERDRSRH